MLNQKLLLALAISAGLVDIALGQGAGRVWTRQSLSPRQDNNNQDNGGQDNGGQANNQATCLNPAVIQQGSADDGQSQGDKGIKAGQAKSDT